MSLSFRTQNRLASLIQTIAEAEKKTEVTRQVLAEQKQFEPHTAFRRLDLTRDGYVTSSELIEFLNANNVVATTKEQLALFAGLDFNEDGLISYNDFINTILPQEDSKLKSLTTLRESYYLEAGIPLPYEVEWGLTRVFEQEIKNYRNIENQKDVLAASYDYNTLDAFNTIDEEQLGFIDYESIDKFQRNNSKILSEDEILAFLRVVGENGRVNYTQFANAVGGTRTIQPVSSPSKLERTISPYKSRDNYYNTLQDQLNRSIERQRQLKLEQDIQESQARLDRSIDLARSQQKVDQLERQIERQKSQEKIERLERTLDRQRSIDRLNRSIQLQQSASRVERQLERQRSQEKINALERSIDLQRSIDQTNREIELQKSIDRTNRALELQKSIDRTNREIELQKSIDRTNREIELQKSIDRAQRDRELQRSIDRAQRDRELQRSIDRANRDRELQKSIERSNRQLDLQRSIDRTNRQLQLQKSIDRTNRQLDLQKSQDRIDRLNRSIELQKSQDRLEKSIQLSQAQDRLNRSIERTRQLEIENELAKSRREAEQVNLELELQQSLNKSRRLEAELLEASINKGSGLNTPLKGNEESVLVNSLKQQINVDREIEEIKKQLALRVDFNLLDAFRIFDSKGRGYVTKLEFELALNDIGIYPTKDEMYLLYKRFDTDADGLLRYSEFTKICSPSSSEYSTLMSNRAPHYLDNSNGIETFDHETRYTFKKLLNKVLQGEVEAEALRQKLARRPQFSATDAFNALDQNENGFISIDEFKQTLNDWGFFVTSNDLITLVNRYDKNQDGKVSYGEFLNEITPKSPVKY